MKVASSFLISWIVLAGSLVSTRAEVTEGESYGYGVFVDGDAEATLSIDFPVLPDDSTGLLSVDTTVGPFPGGVSGVAPGPYAASDSTVEVDSVSIAGLSLLSNSVLGTVDLAAFSGTFYGEANSNVDGLPGSRSADGTGGVENLTLNLADLSIDVVDLAFLDTTLVSFTQSEATTLESMSMVSGDFGGLTRTGSSVIADLDVSIAGDTNLSTLLGDAGISFDTDIDGNIEVDPNTTLTIGVVGNGSVDLAIIPANPSLGVTVGSGTTLTLTLNKQVEGGDGVNFASIETTALEVLLSGLDMDLEVDAELPVSGAATVGLAADGQVLVVLGRSYAELTAVPEAGTFAWLAVGAFGFLIRSRRR